MHVKTEMRVYIVTHDGIILAGNDVAAEAEILDLARACHGRDALLKVILETALLSEDEKVRGATAEDVALLRSFVDSHPRRQGPPWHPYPDRP